MVSEERLDALEERLEGCLERQKRLVKQRNMLMRTLKDIRAGPGFTMDWKHLARHRSNLADTALEQLEDMMD